MKKPTDFTIRPMFNQVLGDIWEVVDPRGFVRSIRRSRDAAIERARQLRLEAMREAKD